MPLEVERKYLGVDFAALRAALRGMDARSEGRHFESNMLFDTRDAGLRKTRRLLRLRTQEWAREVRHVLTLKLPAAEAGRFKVREERELLVESGPAMRSVLEGLGYHVLARYEKVREAWSVGGISVDMDILPFAYVVEMEGAAEGIRRLEERLGLDKAAISTKSYHELHREWRLARGLPPELSFVFDAAGRLALRRELGLDPVP